MYRASTPTHEFDLGTDVNSLEKILLTYKQNGEVIIRKTKEDLQLLGTSISVTLTQEETNLFQGFSKASVQVRIKTESGKVIPYEEEELKVLDVHDDEVL